MRRLRRLVTIGLTASLLLDSSVSQALLGFFETSSVPIHSLTSFQPPIPFAEQALIPSACAALYYHIGRHLRAIQDAGLLWRRGRTKARQQTSIAHDAEGETERLTLPSGTNQWGNPGGS